MTSFALIPEDPRCMVDSEGTVYGVTKILKPKNVGDGYKAASVNRRSRYIHRLVAEAFLDNPKGKREVAHWDGNKSNNAPSNLRWATRHENEEDKLRHGTRHRGQKAPDSKLSDSQVDYIREHANDYRGAKRDLAIRFGVSKSLVTMICKGQVRK